MTVSSRADARGAHVEASRHTSDAVEPLVWINGERRPGGGAHVSAYDRGVTLADGVFETMRVRGVTAFRLDRHLARLHRGMAALEIPAPPELEAWLRVVVRADAAPPVRARDTSLRITVTRGVGPPGVGVPTLVVPTVIITLGPMPAFPASIYDNGLSAHVASGRRNEHAMTAGLKTLAYTDAVAGLMEARRAGADEALFLDTEGHCSEASASNLFLWTGSMLMTPPLSCGVLPGVTREAVLDLARAEGLPVAERAFRLEELLASEEAFLTSSLRGLAPVVRVGPQVIGRGTPGPIARRLTAAYGALVDRECGT